MPSNNIVVVGGGTAGWITALYAKKMYPLKNIILIESTSIGILGAGEGSVPEIIELFDFLDIPFSSLVKNCMSTVKNGIKFSNWKTNSSFFHPFQSSSIASNDYNFYINNKIEQNTSFSHICAATLNDNFEDYVFMQKLSNDFKVPFIENKKNININNKIQIFDQISLWSLHFDAKILADYLSDIGQKRQIKKVDGIVKNISIDSNGNVKTLITDSIEIDVDFVFDCTGFRRLIIGDLYKSTWKSYSDTLPAKKAIPFFLEINKEIPPYTEASAMNFGWEWKIPLQHRYGCGYVFDSDFITEDEVKKEIDKKYKKNVEIPKVFSFSPGCYENIWINNCLAIGISANFLEPLEATSIWQSYRSLKRFFSLPENIYSDDKTTKKNFNKIFIKETEEIVDFIYLHYVTKKTENDFWKNFTKNNKMPEFVSYILDVSKKRPLSESVDFFDKMKIFNFYNYYYILLGNEILTRNDIKKQSRMIKNDKFKTYLNIKQNQSIFIKNAKKHNDFLNILKNY